MNQLVEAVEKEFKRKKVPYFRVGDTVKVHTRIVEGDKERVQIYEGVVVARKGSGLTETFTVSRVAFGYANEKIFPLHAPTITDIEVVRKGDVRKAKLNYLRGKVGRASKVKAIFGGLEEGFYADNASMKEESSSPNTEES